MGKKSNEVMRENRHTPGSEHFSDKLSQEELILRRNLITKAKKIAADPEYALCGKLGLGACWIR